MAGGGGEKSLSETPTWAVAVVATAFVLLSVIIEHSIHSLGKWFHKRHKKAMSEALEKIKAELMLLGFLSLLLTVGTQYISKICIPAKLGDIMLPCKRGSYKNVKKDQINNNIEGRKLFSNDNNIPFPDELYEIMWRRALAEAGAKPDYCSIKNPDKVALISYTGVHQLHIFIFVLAVFHVLYSVITIALAKAKMRRWKAWELETSSVEYQFTNDPERFRFARQTSFVKRHSGLSRVPGIRWIVAFFRQFFRSVTKVDYLTMRHGFINAHFAPNAKFDFRRYIKRSMEDDFKRVVGISIPLWIFAIIFLLVNVYKWYTLSWLSLAPFIILLLVGTKLEIIIMEMAEEIQQKSTIVKGAPTVEPNNKYFWFNNPHWILILIHFTLFQNAFQMAYFLWTWYEFGLTSCFHEKLALVVTRVSLGVVLQFICSYITFPLYSLVTQMGSHMKQAIFEEQTAKALKNWQRAAKNKNKFRKTKDDQSTSQSQSTSPIHLLHNHNHRSSVDIESVVNSQRFYHSDTDLSDSEHNSVHRPVLTQKPHPDFSFEKPS